MGKAALGGGGHAIRDNGIDSLCIVGMVAGHARDDDGVIELRRMECSSKRRGLD
jgi:hypothetical protein